MTHEDNIGLIEGYLRRHQGTMYEVEELCNEFDLKRKGVEGIMRGLMGGEKIMKVTVVRVTRAKVEGRTITTERVVVYYTWWDAGMEVYLTGKGEVDQRKLIRTKTGILDARYMSDDEWFAMAAKEERAWLAK